MNQVEDRLTQCEPVFVLPLTYPLSSDLSDGLRRPGIQHCAIKMGKIEFRREITAVAIFHFICALDKTPLFFRIFICKMNPFTHPLSERLIEGGCYDRMSAQLLITRTGELSQEGNGLSDSGCSLLLDRMVDKS
jgi:hypothetical protein